MPKFEVEINIEGYYTVQVEAETEEEACFIAEQLVTLDNPAVHIDTFAEQIED